MKQVPEKGCLYVVATPVGNLDDITIRAVSVLKGSDAVIAEDTRTARKLMNVYSVSKPVYSYHAPREKEQVDRYIRMLSEGKDLALVSESGTPCISDPGNLIVSRAVAEGIRVVPIPGPSSPVCALSVSGLIDKEFVFLGFLPRKGSALKKTLFPVLELGFPVVFFESKHRIRNTVGLISSEYPDCEMILAREMTKKFEEIIRGKASELPERLEAMAEKGLKGEFTAVCRAR